MAEKDMTEKILMSYADVFADCENVLTYGGEAALRPEELRQAPTESFYKVNGKNRSQFCDVSFYWVRRGKIIVQYMIENETQLKRRQVLRKASYEGGAYRTQLESGQPVYPVVSCVFEWTRKKSRIPLSLHKLLEADRVRQDVSAVNGTGQNAPAVDGTKEGAPMMDGTELGAPVMDGTGEDAPMMGGTELDASAVDRTREDAPMMDETELDAPAVDGTEQDTPTAASMIQRTLALVDDIRLIVHHMSNLPPETRRLFVSDMGFVVDYLNEGSFENRRNQKIVHVQALCDMMEAITGDRRFTELAEELLQRQQERNGVAMCEYIDMLEARGFARGEASGEAKGFTRGEAKGILKGENRLAQLIQILLKEHKYAELSQIADNSSKRYELYQAYGI